MSQHQPQSRTNDQFGKQLPSSVSLCAVGLGIEALLVGGAGIMGLVSALEHRDSSLPMAIGLVILALVAAWVLISAGIALVRRRRWARSYGFTWQIMQLCIAWPVLSSTSAGSDLIRFGVYSLTALSVVMLIALVKRTTTAHLEDPAGGHR